MPKQKILPFLTRLTRHNSKEWMHAHQAEYLEAKAAWLTEIERILQRLRQHDPQFETVTARQAIFRITDTNRQFHPDKPRYRDRFGCAPVQDMYRPGLFHLAAQDLLCYP